MITLLTQQLSIIKTYWSALPSIYKKIIIGTGIYVGITSFMAWGTGYMINNSAWCSPKLRQQRQFDGSTYAIVTGANGGIGKEIAKQLMLDGCNVIMACRNQTKAESAMEELNTISQQQQHVHRREQQPSNAKHGKLVFLKLDLSSKKCIDEFLDKFFSLNIECNILIHNAAIVTSQTNQFSDDNMNVMWQANYLSQVYLTLCLLQHIIEVSNKHKFGRIVNVNSFGHVQGKAEDIENFLDDEKRNDRFYVDESVSNKGVGLYSSNKLANAMFVDTLHEYVERNYPRVLEYLCVCCVHPGIVDTPMVRQDWKIGHPLLYTQWRCFALLSAKQGALQVLHAVYCDIDNERYLVNGKYHTNARYVPYNEKTRALLKEYAHKLWKKSLEIWPVARSNVNFSI